jgi:hypothetical protein
MSITLENVIAELRQAVPSFTVDPEWEAEGLSYLVFGDFARFVSSEAEVLQYVASDEEATRLSMVPVCMMFLERAVEEGIHGFVTPSTTAWRAYRRVHGRSKLGYGLDRASLRCGSTSNSALSHN